MADQLLGVLQSLRGTFSLGLFAWAHVKDPSTQDTLVQHDVFILEDGLRAVKPGHNRKLPIGTKMFDVTISRPDSPPDYEHLSEEFGKMLLRNFTSDCFEAIKDYCDESGQLPVLKVQPWYQFARLVRNCLTHTQCWRFQQYDLAILPVTWNGKTIDVRLQGKESDVTMYDWFDACMLYAAMFDFAKTLK